uniref:NADH-ubiquinone oxidoreductase chain 6 n=2 Tax=Lepisosteus TaxID=7916 RepID=Q8HQM2_LEPOC|nr:NADH dehydrogenase subunit 6 [Lepisosteus oculatus]YP_009239728.1 NADH dehydrogenase subunit 6 [Lepisosteus platyrhincus]AAR16140.1 NADH dehydrogenase subunit 6 [Lepisosteus oculatus]AMM06329.1 NADH dehydrogenase subunit 6 [Lepisosteus platyrhincus]BAB40740.1 NADH dehydrogenase subunits 6 [Lepisosteus oculatus]
MVYLVFLFLLGLVLGLIAVASNPAPFFGAFGLVVAAAFGCGILVVYGGSFLSLILFLIYLGGMMVVFAYSAALAAEPYPETWGAWSVLVYVIVSVIGVLGAGYWFVGEWDKFMWVAEEFMELGVLRGDFSGVALVYDLGGGMLIVCGWVLLLTLFVVLELIRGMGRGCLRAI